MLSKRWLSRISLIFIPAGCFLLLSCTSLSTLKILTTESDTILVLLDAGISSYADPIVGVYNSRLKFSIKNTSKWNFKVCAFSILILDDNGNEVWKGRIHFSDFEKMEVKSGSTDLPYEMVDRCKSCKVAFIPEESTTAVKFSLEMSEPAKNADCQFSDENIEIKFSFERFEVFFELENRTEQPIKIDWEKLSFIGVESLLHRIVHRGIDLDKLNLPQTPTVVPPKSKMADILIPSDNIYYEIWYEVKRWKYHPLIKYPPISRLNDYIGKYVSIFFPLQIRDKEINYNFKFKIISFEPK